MKPTERAEDFTCTILSDHGGHDVEQHDYEAVQALIESRDNAVRLALLDEARDLGANVDIDWYRMLRAKYGHGVKPQP